LNQVFEHPVAHGAPALLCLGFSETPGSIRGRVMTVSPHSFLFQISTGLAGGSASQKSLSEYEFNH
jgi:hypothetical protein